MARKGCIPGVVTGSVVEVSGAESPSGGLVCRASECELGEDIGLSRRQVVVLAMVNNLDSLR